MNAHFGMVNKKFISLDNIHHKIEGYDDDYCFIHLVIKRLKVLENVAKVKIGYF